MTNTNYLKCPDGWKPLPSVGYAHCLICNGYSPPAWNDERLKPVRHKRWCWLKKAWRALIRAPEPRYDYWFLPSDKGEDPMIATEPKAHPDMTLWRGTKELYAKPMNKAEYCAYRGWQVPEDENPAEIGWLVEYRPARENDRNHPDHKGYISWSPHAAFEEAYRPCGSHVDRMRIELDELEDRIAKLRTFTQGDVFAVLEDIDKLLLENQLSSMTTYQQALALRLHRATANEGATQETAQDGSGEPALTIGGGGHTV